MTSILLLRAGPRGADAFSNRMADEVVDRLRLHHPDATVVTRDLATTPPPFPDAAFSAAILAPPADPVAPALALSEELIRELEAAAILVIATPMHNFGVPAALKAWIDHIVRIHRTFASTPAGKIGLLANRPAWLVVASGGWFTHPTPTGAPAQPDFLTHYLRIVLSTIGIHDTRVLTLEGVTRGPDMVERAWSRARAALDAALPAPR